MFEIKAIAVKRLVMWCYEPGGRKVFNIPNIVSLFMTKEKNIDKLSNQDSGEEQMQTGKLRFGTGAVAQ